MPYLSVCGDDDLSQVVVHGGHGLADGVQGHVHLPLHPVAVGEQAHQLHDDLRTAKRTTAPTLVIRDGREKFFENVAEVVTRTRRLPPGTTL